MNGVERIQQAFESSSQEGRAALMPYFTLGYPSPHESMDIVEAIARAGADLIELGIPFSDPLADGPTIQSSTQAALAQGVNVAACLEMVSELRSRRVRTPFLLMGYVNPLMAYGFEAFVSDAVEAGADGFIVPDLPPEEAAALEALCRGQGRALVYFLAPTSTPERIQMVAQRSTGFIYLVSVTGVTGARGRLPDGLGSFVRRVRSASAMPLAVGFGIATPDQARQVGDLADGVIVGSALIDSVRQSPDGEAAASAFVAGLRGALNQPAAAD
jgi:tryptophan synthase alpha chain